MSSPMPCRSSVSLGARPWLPSIERLLLRAARDVQPLAALTPVDALGERARLTAELRAGRPANPRWTYARVAHAELRRALASAEHDLAGSGDPLRALYLARVRELSLEAALCESAGTEEVARLARVRFAPDPQFAQEASWLCARWLDEPDPEEAPDCMPSDASHPRSLLSQMREAVGRLRLPFAVVVHPALTPLAATGDRVILVASGRTVSEADAVRTVLHEVEGHARPRACALEAPIALFRVGTARGADDQEGRALLLEERLGFLCRRRRRQLASRHWAVEQMLGGGSFADVASLLVSKHGLDPADSVLASERVFRGSYGRRPGLGRERVYLESLLRVRAHLARRPDDERIIATGQVAVDAAESLRPYAAGPF